MYLEIAEGGNFKLLLRKGRATVDQCEQAWEEIIKDNAEATGDSSYSAYFILKQTIALLENEFLFVKACLIKLQFVIDDDIIAQLKTKGYKIKTGSYSEYVASLEGVSRRASNIITKIKMKVNELNANFAPSGSGAGQSLEAILASISASLGYAVNEDVTLARFNEYSRIIRLRNTQNKKDL